MNDPGDIQNGNNAYVLVTAAYNEEAYIEKTLRSVVSQTIAPTKWIIVSDGSTDHTEEIVSEYAARYSQIELVNITEPHPRNFAAQVNAINLGVSRVRQLRYDFIGNLDADISIHSCEYFATLLQKFRQDPRLGLAGGFIYESQKGLLKSRKHNSRRSVPHAVQLFRRECFEQCGGYIPLKYGGPDWHAEVGARMNGWRVEAFPELVVVHHRPTGTAGGILRYSFQQGRMDYSMGSHPLFEALKITRRFSSKPYCLGALARLGGFMWSVCQRDQHLAAPQVVDSLRREQLIRMRSALLNPWSRN